MKRIDELLGIIYGINYDGVINEKEIELLTLWVKDNSDSDVEVIVQATDLLKDILKDGIITDDEKDQLFEFLKSREKRRFFLAIKGTVAYNDARFSREAQMKELSSVHNPQIKQLRRLQDASGRREQGKFLCEGIRISQVNSKTAQESMQSKEKS